MSASLAIDAEHMGGPGSEEAATLAHLRSLFQQGQQMHQAGHLNDKEWTQFFLNHTTSVNNCINMQAKGAAQDRHTHGGAGPGPGSTAFAGAAQDGHTHGGAGPGPGSTELVSAYDFMHTPIRVMPRRLRPAPSSKTNSANRKSFNSINKGKHLFDGLEELEAQLQRCTDRFCQVNDSDVTHARSEDGVVNRLWNAILHPVNQVAAALGIPARFRSAGEMKSKTDITMRWEEGDLDEVIGCLEAKGMWQWELTPGYPIWANGGKKSEPALQQLFGDMVMEEVHIGMLCNENQAGFLSRHHDPKCMDLEASDIFNCDSGVMPVRLLFLWVLQSALRRFQQHGRIPRQSVPRSTQATANKRGGNSSGEGSRGGSRAGADRGSQGGPGGASSRKRGAPDGSSGVERSSGGGQPIKPSKAPRRSKRTAGAGNDIEAVEQRVSEEDKKEEEEAAAGKEDLPVWGLADVILGQEIGSGSSGIVYEGKVGRRAAAVKLFASGTAGEQAMLKELSVYEHLRDLQGLYIPRVLAHGLLDHCYYPFMATSLEGASLGASEADTVTTKTTRMAAARALGRLHACGVAHGDVQLDNLVRSKSSQSQLIMLVDLGHATIGASKQQLEEDSQRLASLFAPTPEGQPQEEAVVMQACALQKRELEAELASRKQRRVLGNRQP